MTRGFTLLEMLVVLAILGILFAIGLPSYLGWQQSLRAREAASNIVDLISEAKITARNQKQDVTFTLDPTQRTARLTRGTTTLRTTTLGANVSCIQVRTSGAPSCGTGNDLIVMAPYGTLDTSPAAIQVTSGAKSVWVYIIGVTGKLVVR